MDLIFAFSKKARVFCQISTTGVLLPLENISQGVLASKFSSLSIGVKKLEIFRKKYLSFRLGNYLATRHLKLTKSQILCKKLSFSSQKI